MERAFFEVNKQIGRLVFSNLIKEYPALIIGGLILLLLFIYYFDNYFDKTVSASEPRNAIGSMQPAELFQMLEPRSPQAWGVFFSILRLTTIPDHPRQVSGSNSLPNQRVDRRRRNCYSDPPEFARTASCQSARRGSTECRNSRIG